MNNHPCPDGLEASRWRAEFVMRGSEAQSGAAERIGEQCR